MSALDANDAVARWTWRFLFAYCAGALAAIGWIIWRLCR